uniref:RING-type E3 ubiquitin transferase n=1 Tax=Ornithorhynchus anatinus TaxID=9258 RepID=A0A6I8N8R3_ORNAN
MTCVMLYSPKSLVRCFAHSKCSINIIIIKDDNKYHRYYYLLFSPSLTPRCHSQGGSALHLASSCTECKEKRAAHSLCTHCNKWLCSSCTEEHSHGPEEGDHYLSLSQKASPGADGGPSDFSLCCPLHSQEALKLFCETCDVLTCRSCLLLEHKEHRFRHLEEALQNQRLLLENVTAQVEEKKTGLQASAKQIEDRLFEVKHLHRKVENQIKMAKMVLMNELNKQANGLLEQLEGITNERKHKLEQQLQSIMVLNRQFEHVQNFISWAVCSKNSNPFLFSKELIVFQMQRLLETSCNTDVGSPWKIRFTWEPSFWTKQLSSLGCITTEGGPPPPSDVPGYGTGPGLPPAFYHGHHSPAPPPDPLNHQPQKFPVCCSHCAPGPPCHKGQAPHPGMHHHHQQQQPQQQQQQLGFRQASEPRQLSAQYATQAGEKEQACGPHPLRPAQPWLEQQPHLEPESAAPRMGKPPQAPPPAQPGGHPACVVPPRDAPSATVPPVPPGPSVRVQLGHHAKPKPSHLPQQPPMQPPQAPPPSPLSSGQNDGPPQEPVLHQNLDLIHHKFELEEMQKDLELLLQAQQPSLQLNQTKPPQHVQQTIVGQINYIVRQPAPIPPQAPEEVHQACDDPMASEGPKPVLPLDRPVMVPPPQALAEEVPVGLHRLSDVARCSSPNLVTKRAASMSILGFSGPLERELTSPRPARSVEPQIQSVTSLSAGRPQNSPFASEVQPELLPVYGPALTRAPAILRPGGGSELPPTGDGLLGNSQCKMENQNFSPISDSSGPDPVASCLDVQDGSDLPAQKMLDEPINLSVKKPPRAESPAAPIVLPPVALKQFWDPEDCGKAEQESFDIDPKRNQNIRVYDKELKVPYVRLERLKICGAAAPSGELPVFKLQPQNGQQDGTFLLIIECGAQTSTMAIKVNQDSGPEPVKPQPEDSEERKVLTGLLGGQRPPGFEDVYPGEHRLGPGIPGGKRPSLDQDSDPIENEDFCAVCLNGGELLCCDHCPKVYHLSCHVPALLSFPVGEWVCALCRNLTKPEVEYDCDNTRYSRAAHQDGTLRGLNDYDQKKCEKLVLSLCCSSLSLPFHEPVSPLARHYYQIIKRPMDLSIIRRKLQKKDIAHYSSPEEVVADVRLMFWNCAKFNYPDSEVAEAGRCLEVFFEGWLKEIYPEKLFALPLQEDSDSEDLERGAPRPFQWPAYGQESVQPKRRRRQAESERAKRMSFRLANSFPQV